MGRAAHPPDDNWVIKVVALDDVPSEIREQGGRVLASHATGWDEVNYVAQVSETPGTPSDVWMVVCGGPTPMAGDRITPDGPWAGSSSARTIAREGSSQTGNVVSACAHASIRPA